MYYTCVKHIKNIHVKHICIFTHVSHMLNICLTCVFLNMCLTDVVIFPVYALNCKDEMSSPFLNTKKMKGFSNMCIQLISQSITVFVDPPFS